jgi:hypothetical protein
VIMFRLIGEGRKSKVQVREISAVNNERLEVVPSSGQILDYVGSGILKTNLEIGNNTIVVGDIKPLFQDGRFIRFTLKVVS